MTLVDSLGVSDDHGQCRRVCGSRGGRHQETGEKIRAGKYRPHRVVVIRSTFPTLMQVTVFAGLLQRLVYYACTMYVNQLEPGQNYSDPEGWRLTDRSGQPTDAMQKSAADRTGRTDQL